MGIIASPEAQDTWELHDQAQALQRHRIHGNYTTKHRLFRGTEYMGTTRPITGSSEPQNTWELHDQAQALQRHRIHGNYTTKHRLFRGTEYMGTTRPITGSSEPQNTWELHDQAQALQRHRIHGNYTTKHRLFRATEYITATWASLPLQRHGVHGHDPASKKANFHGHTKAILCLWRCKTYRLQLWINTAHRVNGSSTAEDKQQNTMMAPVNQH